MRYKAEYTFCPNRSVRTHVDDPNVAEGDFRLEDKVFELNSLHPCPADPTSTLFNEGGPEPDWSQGLILIDPTTGGRRHLFEFLQQAWRENRTLLGVIVSRDVCKRKRP